MAPQSETLGAESARLDPPTVTAVSPSVRVPDRRDLLLVAAVAVGLRLVAAVLLVESPRGLADPFLYQAFGQAIAAGYGYISLLGQPTAYYPPGYPFTLAVLQWPLDRLGVPEALPAVAAVGQALLGGVTAAAVAVGGGRLAASLRTGPAPRAVGLAAGLLVAAWPNLVVYSTVLLSETLFVALVSVALAAVLTVGRDVRWGAPLAVAAVVTGLATTVRPQALLYVPAVAAAWAVGRVPWRRIVLGTAVLLAGAAVVVAPWTLRNVVVMGAPVAVSTNLGDNLCIGFQDGASGGFSMNAACGTGTTYVDGPAVEVARNDELQRRAVAWVGDHLGELPGLSVRKLWITFGSDWDAVRAAESYGAAPQLSDGVRPVVHAAFDLTWWLLVAVAGVGLVVVGRSEGRRDVAGPVVILTGLAGAVVPVLFFGDPRFKMGVAPSLILLAGVGVVAVLGRLHPRQRGSTT
ncbi:MAG: hypothetical protein FJW94_04370 [Actinobacteria bacterium]|nr:hypothetical protein [Actinomycetota bacterium]